MKGKEERRERGRVVLRVKGLAGKVGTWARAVLGHVSLVVLELVLVLKLKLVLALVVVMERLERRVMVEKIGRASCRERV